MAHCPTTPAGNPRQVAGENRPATRGVLLRYPAPVLGADPGWPAPQFQKSVWAKLSELAWGEVTSYGAHRHRDRTSGGRAGGRRGDQSEPGPDSGARATACSPPAGRSPGTAAVQGVRTKAWLLDHEGIIHSTTSAAGHRAASDHEFQFAGRDLAQRDAGPGRPGQQASRRRRDRSRRVSSARTKRALALLVEVVQRPAPPLVVVGDDAEEQAAPGRDRAQPRVRL